MSLIKEIDIKNWVEESATRENREFREAVHTVLSAIASDKQLKTSMILKGGILLAIRYNSHRYTKDIDFSTEQKLGDKITPEKVQDLLDKSLSMMVELLDYDLDCRVQSCVLQPNNPKSTFPSIKIKVGYAYKGTPKHKRLLSIQSPDTVSIDYSLNEATYTIEDVKLDINDGVLVYSLTDLIAEKYRSLLQQKTRNRNRRQDVYDLNLLINELGDIDEDEKSRIQECLIWKSKSRGIEPNASSFDDKEIKERAQREYPTLASEIEGDLPDFDEIFNRVATFYRSLPW